MSRTMYRGKQQVLFNYLPGRIFDFERATIARVTNISGTPRTNLNASILLRKIAEAARAWHPDYRPLLRDDVLRDRHRFVLLDPHSVQSEMFPKVFWCQNRNCGLVFDYSQENELPPRICGRCNHGNLAQIRFIKIHRCGSIQPLRPRTCPRCHTSNHMALDTRGSERISNFRWLCRQCNNSTTLFGGWCTECQWPNEDHNLRRMDIEVHRARRTFYAHTAVLLNIPHQQLDTFFDLTEWSAIVAAKFFNLPEVAQRPLIEFITVTSRSAQDTGLSGDDLDKLLRRQANGELTPEEFVVEINALRSMRKQEREESSPLGIMHALEQRTGVLRPIWEHAGHEMLEAVIPLEFSQPQDLFNNSSSPTTRVAQRMGLSRLSLMTDFPIINATYGYSRAEYSPNECRLNPFPPVREHRGRFPIFVDQVQADALLISLNVDRVINWIERNEFTLNLPQGNDPYLVRRAYFVQLFDDVPLREKIHSDSPHARLVFSLLHTMSHLFVKQAAHLCGLDTTSLSEYVLPRVLTFAIYCNHRFGATIGALTALFEQSTREWLNTIRETNRCVYDPVCYDNDSNCHACTHLPETSCRFYNLNLSRAMLFGGLDPELGPIRVGYFDSSLSTEL